jgi:lipopolysaccharide/colanic/teichoic acid biosynthesis glycosyltransferase
MKRLFDVVLSAIALLVLLPVFILLSLLVLIYLGRPILYSQNRPGKNGQPFKMHKFRTMTNATDDSGRLLPNEERLTGFGRFLRSTSLDELPELINVIKGDMSIVGPRPLLMEYLELYTRKESRRHEVRPGITGLAQIRGRNSLSWRNKFRYDIFYVDHHNLFLDVKLICETVGKVLKRSNISTPGSDTIERFKGTDNE